MSVVDRKINYMEILQKPEEYVEMNKLSLSTNKTELLIFSRVNFDFGSIFYKNEALKNKKKLHISWYSNWQES